MGSTPLRGDDARILDFIHRHVGGAVCTVCGAADRPVAAHLIKYTGIRRKIEYTGVRGGELPRGFLPFGDQSGPAVGTLAVCEECAPPCPLCELPVVTSAVKQFFETTTAALRRDKGGMVEWGEGHCPHSHFWRMRTLDS